MLAGKYRLSGNFYINRAKEKGKLYQFSHFGVSVFQRVKSGINKPSKFAFVVSTKIAKHAVDRNRIKRTLSETIRFESKYLVPGYDVVFLVKKSIMRQPTDLIMRQTREALKKTRLVSDKL